MMSQPILKDIQAVCEGLHKIALTKLPAPEGMGRDAKFELRHHTCEFASNFPDPPIMEEEPYDGTLSDEKGTWRKFMCPICHDRIVIQFLTHPTSESGTNDLRFQVGKLLEEQGEDFRLAHAELLDAYHAMEANDYLTNYRTGGSV